MSKKNKQYHVYSDAATDLIVETTTPEQAVRSFLAETGYKLNTDDQFEVFEMIPCGRYSAVPAPTPPPKIIKLPED